MNADFMERPLKLDFRSLWLIRNHSFSFFVHHHVESPRISNVPIFIKIGQAKSFKGQIFCFSCFRLLPVILIIKICQKTWPEPECLKRAYLKGTKWKTLKYRLKMAINSFFPPETLWGFENSSLNISLWGIKGCMMDLWNLQGSSYYVVVVLIIPSSSVPNCRRG